MNLFRTAVRERGNDGANGQSGINQCLLKLPMPEVFSERTSPPHRLVLKTRTIQ